MSTEALLRRIERAMTAIRAQNATVNTAPHVVFRLPLRDDEPAIPRREGNIEFYVPAHRQSEQETSV